MSYKIYLIKHLDTDMKYVGITGGDLATRWEQHRADTNSAVYKALRTEGYRMTMELLEEVNTKPEALKKEQEYIQSLGTATPNGWNRQVSTPKVQSEKYHVFHTIRTSALFKFEFIGSDNVFLECPLCASHKIYFYTLNGKTIERSDCSMHKFRILENPPLGTGFYFECKQCHKPNDNYFIPPFVFEIFLFQGKLKCEVEYYIPSNKYLEDES
jgi:predicted GIY-YIG superfamily endonuclease